MTDYESKMREAFEAAMASKGYHQPPALYRDGTYRDTCYAAGWDAWRAAINLAKGPRMNKQAEREAFEAWAATQPRHEGVSRRFLASINAYVDADLHGSWLGWQARASTVGLP
jgi:hypothetical protein